MAGGDDEPSAEQAAPSGRIRTPLPAGSPPKTCSSVWIAAPCTLWEGQKRGDTAFRVEEATVRPQNPAASLWQPVGGEPSANLLAASGTSCGRSWIRQEASVQNSKDVTAWVCPSPERPRRAAPCSPEDCSNSRQSAYACDATAARRMGPRGMRDG